MQSECHRLLGGAELTGANLSGANLSGTIHSTETRWPSGFTPLLR
ncbi:pentapeptide repeat-containing protein [Nocardia aurea]